MQVSDETLLSLLEKVNEQIAPKMTARPWLSRALLKPHACRDRLYAPVGPPLAAEEEPTAACCGSRKTAWEDDARRLSAAPLSPRSQITRARPMFEDD